MKAVALINIALLGSLTFLAWHFEKWWIVLLFPILALSYKERRDND